ncbi:MFS transporter [Glycomyces paridis]|uniref:MFS transporter n=1 Tax=Glycomyces paridis TaxID=2126555 RepID=A0A4S8P3S9_9ACTN|nr:MFS transporter [Glycomyces paridis]THV24618.1 MFS transporter [Glycomyces paridis]
MATVTPAERRPEDWTDAEVAKGLRAFMLIWAAQLTARIGNGLTAFGLGVHVYRETGQSTAVALVTMAAFLPGVLLAPLGGVLADRFDRRLLMILGDGLSAVGLVALLVLLHNGIGSVAVICACVAFGSLFTSVMDPAYRATVSDLLTPEQYARAGGLVQFTSAAQYLVSPAIAGVLMGWFGIRLVLMVDIATMAVTVACMALVWRTVKSPRRTAPTGFWEDFRSGVSFLAAHRGITVLMLLVTLVTFCMGFLQTLLTPMVIDLSSEEVLGAVRSVAAVGMVVASLAIGVFNMGSRHLTYIAVALAAAGVTVAAMGVAVNVLLIGAFAFLFFMTLPPLNTSVEVLARASIPNETQGKVWGLMGLISQLGYIGAYAVSGPLADGLFNPLLVSDGALAASLGPVFGTGPSRGIGLLLVLVGALLVGTALLIPRVKSIRTIEEQLVRQTLRTKEKV